MKKYILLTTIALALWSCSEERFTEIENPDTGAVAYDPAKIVTIVTDLATRGTPISSTTGLTDVGLFCAYTATDAWTTAAPPNKMFNTKLVQTGGAWQYDGSPVYWDAATDNDKYTFFAYAPYASATNGIAVTSTAATAGIPTLTYTVPTDVTLQPDLMVAVPKKDVLPHATVPMQLEHALTCIEFQIAGNGEKVKDISVTGVYMTGSLKMDGSAIATSWTPSGAKTQSFSASLNTDVSGLYTTTPTMSTNLLKGDGYLMMIPQTLGAGAKLKVTYEDNSSIEFDLSGQVWTAGDMKTYNITTEVVVSPAALVIPHTGTDGSLNNIEVTTSKPGIKWTLQTPASWLKLGLLANGSDKGSSVTGTGNQTVYTFADPNATAANFTTTVTLNGATTVVVKVTQLHSGGGLNALSNFYIGAFWREEERGERILRNDDNTTPWVVSVLWMDDNWADGDILLAPGLNSAYTDFAAVNSSPNNAESYPVPVADAKTMLSGTGAIEFRVGLKTKWIDNVNYNAAPARYAVLILSYGADYGSHQKIFLRQGDKADYVMKDGDKGTTSLTTGERPDAVRFSPYNLTHPDFKSGTNTGGTTIASHPLVPERSSLTAADTPDYFTDYPSQAGAFFQWAVDPTMNPVGVNNYTASDYERRAYHPTAAASAFTDWNADYDFPSANAYWHQDATTPLSTANETCPSGWRRPTDGSTSAANSAGAITDSEMRQSLWLNPQNGSTNNIDNSIWGYYADGYFDRRAITNGVGTNSGSSCAVMPSSSTPAYRGNLFFNPTTNASLFFPATGYRDYSDGHLLLAGLIGYSWSSSGTNTTYGWNVGIYSSNVGQHGTYRSHGYSVRCVAE